MGMTQNSDGTLVNRDDHGRFTYLNLDKPASPIALAAPITSPRTPSGVDQYCANCRETVEVLEDSRGDTWCPECGEDHTQLFRDEQDFFYALECDAAETAWEIANDR